MAEVTNKATNTEEAKTNKKTSRPHPQPDIPPECLTLQQKFVELRKACPKIIKQQHSDGVKYKFAKIYDVWEAITPVMNEIGVNFDIVAEVASKRDEIGNPVYFSTMTVRTYNGDRIMFIYEADITVEWINTDDPEDKVTVTLHAIAWNDDPAKAKGSAWTYALKYYLFERFSIDQGEDDPDNTDFGAQAPKSPQNAPNSSGHTNPRQGQGIQNSGQHGSSGGQKKLTEAQVGRLYKKAEDAGMNKEAADARILEKYHKKDPADLSRQEYDEICAALDKAAGGGGV